MSGINSKWSQKREFALAQLVLTSATVRNDCYPSHLIRRVTPGAPYLRAMAAKNDCIPVMLAAAEEPMTEVQENMWVTNASLQMPRIPQ